MYCVISNIVIMEHLLACLIIRPSFRLSDEMVCDSSLETLERNFLCFMSFKRLKVC